MPYATGTEVSVERSKGELERILQRYGATRFIHGWDPTAILVGFELRGVQVKFVIPVLSQSDERFKKTPSGRFLRTPESREAVYNAHVRQRWRALVLVVKAKLEAVDAGISSLEKEFLGDIVLPGGRTVAEVVVPRLVDGGAAIAALGPAPDPAEER